MQVDQHGTAFLVHTSLAGADASGRPGNVFNHVLVLPDLVAQLLAGQPRPLEWYRSPGWLTPYGADAVRTASIGRTALLPGPVVSRASVARFLSRLADAPTLGALLDAVATALAGGPRVVLVADQDEAVHWLAAVCFLAPPQQQAGLSLSTFERAHTLRSGASGALLSVMPRRDRDQLTNLEQHVLIDPLTQRPADGATWRLALGSAPLGPWSALGQALATGTEAVLVDRLLLLDELSTSHPRATAADPMWPLAVVVAESSASSSAQSGSKQVLINVALTAVDHDDADTVRTVLLALEAAAATTVESSWAAWAGLPSQDLCQGNVAWFFERYLALLVGDQQRLQGHWPPDTVDLTGYDDAALQGRLTSTIEAQLVALPDRVGDPVTLSVLNLRLLDLAGLLGIGPALAETPTAKAVVVQLSMLLSGRSAGTIVAACGPVLPQTTRLLLPGLGPLLPGAAGSGRQLKATVADWLLAGTGGNDAGTDRARNALAVMLGEQWMPSGLPQQRAGAALNEVSWDQPWTPAELLEVLNGLAERPDLDVQRLVHNALLRSDLGDPAAVALAVGLLDTELPDRILSVPVRQLAQVHRCCAFDWWRAGRNTWADSAELLLSGLALLHDLVRLPPHLVTQLRPQLVSAAVRALGWSPDDRQSALQSDLLVRLGEVADLHLVTEGLIDALEPLAEMLRHHERLGRVVCLQVARVQLSDRVTRTGVPTEALPLLFQPLADADRPTRELDSLGWVALSLSLHSQPSPKDWLESVLQDVNPLDGCQLQQRDAWVAQALHRAAQLVSSSSPAPITEKPPRSAPWQRPD